MSARVKQVLLYVGTILACYLVAWTAAFLSLNGPDFAFYFEYLAYFWMTGGGERPAFTGLFSILLTVPLSILSVWLLRRVLKKRARQEADGLSR